MSDDKQEVQGLSEPHEAETNVGKNGGRRQFLKRSAVLTSAPVLLSFISRPAFGVFCTPSSIGSSTFLSHHPEESSCGGLSPGAWKGDQGAGSVPADLRATPFFSTSGAYIIFAGVWHDKNGNPWPLDITIDDVLNNRFPLGYTNPADQYEFGAHAIAAYLNAYYRDSQTLGYPMTVADVQEMVNAILGTGQYEYAPGQFWDAQQVVAFIQQTFG